MKIVEIWKIVYDINECSNVASPKPWEGQKFGGAKMFDFR